MLIPYRKKVFSTNRCTQAGYTNVHVLQPLPKHLLPLLRWMKFNCTFRQRLAIAIQEFMIQYTKKTRHIQAKVPSPSPQLGYAKLCTEKVSQISVLLAQQQQKITENFMRCLLSSYMFKILNVHVQISKPGYVKVCDSFQSYKRGQ